MYTLHHGEIATLLEVVSPRSLLLIDPAASRPQGFEGRVLQLNDPGQQDLAQQQPFDLGVVANTLERMEKSRATELLARLRDLYTRRFVALVPLGDRPGQRSHWQESDLLGLGLSRLARYRPQGRSVILYHYAIETYKTTPDWLNARHWAHPENWQA
ncbi:MAG: DUF6231 family protein [Candidatus Competibacteraceae bacterium]|nr:DUF6231 family protein [Candidatus Competibacteraceae bacterium]